MPAVTASTALSTDGVGSKAERRRGGPRAGGGGGTGEPRGARQLPQVAHSGRFRGMPQAAHGPLALALDAQVARAPRRLERRFRRVDLCVESNFRRPTLSTRRRLRNCGRSMVEAARSLSALLLSLLPSTVSF